MNHLRYLVEEIHTTVVATVDECSLPVTCAINLMDWDENGAYFLTAKGKGFYNRLAKKQYLALTGMKGEDTMSCVAVSVRGKVREIGPDRLSVLFEKNPYMAQIYPTEISRQALTVFQLYEGSGEWFDLSKKPIERASFTIGNTHTHRRTGSPMHVQAAAPVSRCVRRIASSLASHMLLNKSIACIAVTV